MNELYANIITFLIPALIEYLVWYGIYEYYEIDYGKIIMCIFIILISIIPITFVLFNISFNTLLYEKYLTFTNNYLVNSILGVIIGYLISRKTIN